MQLMSVVDGSACGGNGEKFEFLLLPQCGCAGSAAGSGDAAPAEEKDDFDIVLTAAGDKKVNVVNDAFDYRPQSEKSKGLVDGAHLR